ncbi:hypothetical protein GCM10022384_55820 [Streptomyces marokkonensis]|uniref:H repeat-associated protein N-terminal domain-containing protein n=1 Tax=Streptomyces marokkonensis TaxID=324855 RepID=A0ABP7RTD1_9ACTN
MLGRLPDPRRVRGRRYHLGSLLALCLVAVLGGAASLAAIARFAADTDSDLREQLGLTSSTPNASPLGRLLARLDGDALDDAVGAWLARYVADPVDEPGDTLVGLAVDGKTMRGSRTDGTAVHLLAAALHACQTVKRSTDRVDGPFTTAEGNAAASGAPPDSSLPDGQPASDAPYHQVRTQTGSRFGLQVNPVAVPLATIPLPRMTHTSAVRISSL